MSTAKNRKLKKLRRTPIWPAVIGMILAATIFICAVFFLLNLFLVSVVEDEALRTYSEVNKLVTAAAELDPSKADDAKKLKACVEDSRKVYSNIGDVAIIDENNNVIWNDGELLPDMSMGTGLLSMFESENLSVVLESRTRLLKFNKGDIDVNILALVPSSQSVEQLRVDVRDPKWQLQPWYSDYVWLVCPMGESGYRMCVDSTVSITNAEAVASIGFLALAVVLGALFLIYQVYSTIRLLVARRRVGKVLQTDFVTGGNNRAYFEREAEKQLKKNKGGSTKYAVALFRVDKYRNYCTVYGANAGEDLLEEVYKVLNRKLTRREVLAHCEKAEFALLLRFAKVEQLNERIQSIMNSIRESVPGRKLDFVTGVCMVEPKDRDVKRLYNEAGLAANATATMTGANIAWFTENMKSEQIWEHQVEEDMERALANKEFAVYLQPKNCARGEKLGGAEALVRWIHPKEGLIAPYKFIPIFEKNGFILKLDDYMISEVAKLQSEWLSEGKKIVPISVNVSRAHFVSDNLAEHICELVDRYNVPHKYIELELTESAFFDDKDVLLATVQKMKDFGFNVSMDDFGAGYSSLNSLKELSPDVIKLDAEFFRGKGDAKKANIIVEDTIALAKRLGMTIVAEGIETREQVDFLADIDCDLIQGYYFAKPMPIDEYAEKNYRFMRPESEDSEDVISDVVMPTLNFSSEGKSFDADDDVASDNNDDADGDDDDVNETSDSNDVAEDEKSDIATSDSSEGDGETE